MYMKCIFRVRHILNVTREIDNFFPGMFTYLNVRVYDDEKTDLLKHWDDTFKYITKAKKEGSKVLVHCKMGVSRSASVVIAYAMKAYNWDFSQAWKHVKEKRNCIKPNNSFLLQLETYQGILDAMKNKEKLQRSKSDTNLKSPSSVKDQSKKEEKIDDRSNGLQEISGLELKKSNQRPKSWSPNVELAENMLPSGKDPFLCTIDLGVFHRAKRFFFCPFSTTVAIPGKHRQGRNHGGDEGRPSSRIESKIDDGSGSSERLDALRQRPVLQRLAKQDSTSSRA